MASASTYVPIANQVLTSATASVTFSSISSTYTDLVLVCNGGITSGTGNYSVQLNSDTGSNYSRTNLSGTGSTATSSRNTSVTYMTLNDYGYLDTTFGTNVVASFMNYANTSTYKTILSRTNNAANGTSAVVNLWRSTAAINTIYIYASASTFLTGSTFTLYGIQAA